MAAVGKDNMNGSTLLNDVMAVWPTFNPHTDLTCIMSALYNTYDCMIWLDDNHNDNANVESAPGAN